jgi:predicted nucleotidyltransferase
MRISEQDSQKIKAVAQETTGEKTRVWLFGSRVDDNAKGGDIDLLIKLEEEVKRPALLASQIAVRLMRMLKGRSLMCF